MVETKINMRFVGYEISGDHVDYQIIATDETGNTVSLSARYSRLREIHDALTKKINKNQLPEFPPKTWTKNNTPTFASQRQKALDNYFGTLLKTFPFDQLAPVKDFIKSGKVLPNQTNAINETKPKSPKNEIQQPKLKQEINIDETLDKIVEKVSGQYYDLKDTPTAPDEDYIKKSKKLYQTLKIDAGIFDIFKVPSGKESNLISIQDETLLHHDNGLENMMDSILDDIRLDREHLNLFSDLDIVVKLDQALVCV